MIELVLTPNKWKKLKCRDRLNQLIYLEISFNFINTESFDDNLSF